MQKTSPINALNRPGTRWLAAIGASIAETWFARRPTFVRPLASGVFLHRDREGSIVLPEVVSKRTPGKLRLATHDIFCFGYTPRPGDTVLDIGAGCGEETLTFSRLVGNHGRVVSIEAHPATYRQLLLTCRYNGLRNVTPLQLAVTDAEKAVAISDGAPPRSSLTATIAETGTHRVSAITIDRLVSSLSLERVDLLKMNIEGAEHLAIKGMTQSLAKIRHVVISCHDFVLQPRFGGGDPAWFATYDRVTEFFRTAGFVLTEPRASDARPELRFYVYGSPG
jgi:FkbM family methyltransferase